jgi:hypothetical protein
MKKLIILSLFVSFMGCSDSREHDALVSKIDNLDLNIQKREILFGIDTTFCQIRPTRECLMANAKEARDIRDMLLLKDSLLKELDK